MTASPDDERVVGRMGLPDTAQPGEADEVVALSSEATELSESDEDVLDSMIESYEHALADQEKFIERSSDGYRRAVTGRSRHRRVRVATTAERREHGPA
jgi:hypothetical protein